MHKNIITNKLFSFIALGAIIAGSLAGLAPTTFADVANVTTLPATSVALTDATLNAVNGANDATGSSFWVSTSTFSTATPTLPDGVYSTNNFGAVASSTPFAASLSSANGLPAVATSTTYYYAAWVAVGDTWYPGAIETVTTLPTPVPTPAPSVVTNPATAVTSSDAILNATNGPADASGHYFWVSTSTFSTASSTVPDGVFSTSDFGAIASSTDFGAALSSVSGLGAITPNTTYYFNAWSNVDGVWYPGAINSLTTAGTTTTGTIGGDVTGGAATVGTLSVTGVTAVKTSAIADGTFSNGWKYVFNITVPTNEKNLSMKFGDWMSTVGSTTLAAANNMRISSAQADNSGATVLVTGANTYTTPTLHMTGDLDPAMDGEQVQVTIEVAVPSSTVNGAYSTSYGVKTQ